MNDGKLILIKHEFEQKRTFHVRAFLKTSENLDSKKGLIATLRKRDGIVDAAFEDESGVWVRLGGAFVQEWGEFEIWVCAVIAVSLGWELGDVDILRPVKGSKEMQEPTKLSGLMMPDDPDAVARQWVEAARNSD